MTSLAQLDKQLADAEGIIALLTTSVEECVEAEEVEALAELLGETRVGLGAVNPADAAPLMGRLEALEVSVQSLRASAENPASVVHAVSLTVADVEARLAESEASKQRLDTALDNGGDGDGDGGGSVNATAMDAQVRVLERELLECRGRLDRLSGADAADLSSLQARIADLLARGQTCFAFA